MSQSEIKQLAEMMDQWNRVEGKAGVPPREARRRAGQMLKVLSISCDIVDAAYRGRGPGEAAPNLYEVSCADGMGYLLSLEGSSLSGVSCLAGDSRVPPAACTLPANADRKTIAAAVLRGKSIACGVGDVKWLGTDAAHFDHVEVTCGESAGYVVSAPRPGHAGALTVTDCQAASASGIRCGAGAPPPLAESGAASSRPSLGWFKEALQRNGVSCQTKQARIVGRESIKRRYFVEFECADRPEGLVAIVPAAGDAMNPFEAMNCATAAQRGIRCQFLAGGQASPHE